MTPIAYFFSLRGGWGRGRGEGEGRGGGGERDGEGWRGEEDKRWLIDEYVQCTCTLYM